MIGFKAKLVSPPPSFEKVIKNINFGTATGLTKTAQQGQDAVVGALKGAFILRTGWWKKNTPVGIRIKPATKTHLAAEVYTDAKFLPVHEEGGTKIPYRNFIAVPTQYAQPNRSRRIAQANLPKNLVNSFVIVTESGTRLLCIRRSRGKNRGVVPMYVLTPRAKQKDVNIFYDPIKRVIDRRLSKNVNEGIDNALRTMR